MERLNEKIYRLIHERLNEKTNATSTNLERYQALNSVINDILLRNTEKLDFSKSKEIDIYIKQHFKGRPKKHDLSKNVIETIEKQDKGEISTKEALEILNMPKATYFNIKKKYKEQVQECILDNEKTKICNICHQEKPLEDFTKNGFTKTGNQRYRPTCKECQAKQ